MRSRRDGRQCRICDSIRREREQQSEERWREPVVTSTSCTTKRCRRRAIGVRYDASTYVTQEARHARAACGKHLPRGVRVIARGGRW